ncbi:MAG: response regulator, partial [Sinobacterium sp.]|nr:response regulator [Sinobacterium sp.]
DYVDKIIHRPSSSQYLVKNLLEYMEAVEDEEESNTDTIVVIDDDDAHGFILSEILMESGWEVEVFDNAYEGMEYIFEQQTKMAFIDCIMPEITGFEAAQKIRIKEKELAISPMTIFAATGLTSASEMNQCISSGMDYVIQKPYNQAEILKVMKTYMAARKVY